MAVIPHWTAVITHTAGFCVLDEQNAPAGAAPWTSHSLTNEALVTIICNETNELLTWCDSSFTATETEGKREVETDGERE